MWGGAADPGRVPGPGCSSRKFPTLGGACIAWTRPALLSTVHFDRGSRFTICVESNAFALMTLFPTCSSPTPPPPSAPAVAVRRLHGQPRVQEQGTHPRPPAVPVRGGGGAAVPAGRPAGGPPLRRLPFVRGGLVSGAPHPAVHTVRGGLVSGVPSVPAGSAGWRRRLAVPVVSVGRLGRAGAPSSYPARLRLRTRPSALALLACNVLTVCVTEGCKRSTGF